MFVLMFTRLTGQEESIFLVGTYDTREEAYDAMRDKWTARVFGDGGWDPDWSRLYDDQAIVADESLYDTCRYFIFDTEHPVGYSNDRTIEFLSDDELG